VPQPIAGVGAILIGCVLAPGDCAGAQPSLDVRSIDFEQRPNDAIAGDRENAAQSRQARAAKRPVEHGLGLIGASVPGGDAIEHAAAQQFPIKVQPDVAGRLLLVILDGGDVGAVKMKRKLEIASDVPHEFGVFDRCGAADTVFDVDDAQRERPIRGELAHGVQQENGIGSARDGDAQACSAGEHAVPRSELGDAIQQVLLDKTIVESNRRIDRGSRRIGYSRNVKRLRAEDVAGAEWAAWYALSPEERFLESAKLWETYLALGGSLDPEPDTQSPFFDPEEWRENTAHGRASVRVLRRGGV